MSKKQVRRRSKTVANRPGQFSKGVSGNPTGRPRSDAKASTAATIYQALNNVIVQPNVRPSTAQRADALHATQAVRDGWQNSSTGMGISGKDKALGTVFCADVIDSETALEIWRGDPMGARIVEVPPNEATRQGFELCIGDDDMPDRYDPPNPVQPQQPGMQATVKPAIAGKPVRNDAVKAFIKRHPSAFERRVHTAIAKERRDAGEAKPLQELITKKLQKLEALAAIRETWCYERAGGGGAIFIGANDFATDLRQPLDLKKIRSLDYLTPLEGRELMPLYWYNDPMQPKFGQPAIYQLTAYNMGAPIDPSRLPRVTQIHESRLIVFPGARVSRRIFATSTRGWGDSVFTRVFRALRMFNTGHQSAETLLSDFAQAIYKIKGLAELITKNPNALTDSMMNVELGRSICRAVVIDAEEDFERKSTSLAGYPDTLDRITAFLASAADMPITLMMGQSPAGLNATGASDIRFFYDRCASQQVQRVAPAILRLVDIELAIQGQDPEATNHSVKFHPLWQPTEKEIAESHFIQAQADAIYIQNDVASPEEIGLSRFGGDQYSYETHLDLEARQDQQAVIAPAVDAKPSVPPPMGEPTTPLPAAAKVASDDPQPGRAES